MQFKNIIIFFFVITLSIFHHGCTPLIPEPDTAKESQSLLVIPFSVEYPSGYGSPVKGWGIKFLGKKDKTILFDPKIGQDYIIVEMEPGSYVFQNLCILIQMQIIITLLRDLIQG